MTWSPDIYTQTWWFAAEAHGDQKVPGTDLPYVTHIGNVAMEVMGALQIERVEKPDLAIQCALLHDVIEDTNVAVDNLEAVFGAEVTAGVLALTKDTSLSSKEAQMVDSLSRIQEQSAEVWLVKLADRITNLRPPPHHWTVEKIAMYQSEARLIYDALHPASNYLGDRLAKKIEVYSRWLEADASI